MSPHRQSREAREQKALEFLRLRGKASAAQIGWAATRGETKGGWAFAQAQNLGLAIAVALMRQGSARPTLKNEFEITEGTARHHAD
ncbi:MAG: hypothetical protein GEU95_01665 [Rhizobiales bacterium]|nr:hypothetical protein [Hyphomicrobiales bacterium]